MLLTIIYLMAIIAVFAVGVASYYANCNGVGNAAVATSALMFLLGVAFLPH